MALPNWPGASSAYSKAYRHLEHLAENGHAKKFYWGGWKCSVSQDMSDLIDALNKGDEEAIKATLLFPDYHS